MEVSLSNDVPRPTLFITPSAIRGLPTQSPPTARVICNVKFLSRSRGSCGPPCPVAEKTKARAPTLPSNAKVISGSELSLTPVAIVRF